QKFGNQRAAERRGIRVTHSLERAVLHLKCRRDRGDRVLDERMDGPADLLALASFLAEVVASRANGRLNCSPDGITSHGLADDGLDELSHALASLMRVFTSARPVSGPECHPIS